MDEAIREKQERIWNHFQNRAVDSFAGATPRLDALLRLASRRAGTPRPVVLNIGAGNGYFERGALARGWASHALDPDGETLAKLAAEGVLCHQGHIEAMPLEAQTFDVVVASEVLEHLTDAQRLAGIEEIARVLKPGGWFLGTVPYEENLAASEVVCPECGVVFHRWGHFRSFTRADIARELAPRFRPVRVRRTAFVAYSGGLAVRVKSLIRVLLARCGQQIAVPSIVWEAQKPR